MSGLPKEKNKLRNKFLESTEGYSKTLTSQDRVFDIPMTETRWLAGARLQLSGHQLGDTIDLQVVHPAAGVMVQFGTNVNVVEGQSICIDHMAEYWAKIDAGLIIRVKYNTTQSTDVGVYADFYFHKEK